MKVFAEGVDGDVEVLVVASRVTALFRAETPVQDVDTLKNFIEDAIRVQLDVAGFVLGHAYEVDIERMIRSDGSPPVVFNAIWATCLRGRYPNQGQAITGLFECMSSPRGAQLRLCLADLRLAIRFPSDTGFFCYRAIESLRQHFVDEGAATEKASWDALRSAIGIDRTAIDSVKALADAPRHGRSVWVSPADRSRVLEATWLIVDRFVDYLRATLAKGCPT